MALNFDNEIPEWKNEGIEPTTELKEKGFTGGYKPPATVFNWFWSKVQKCINELQTKLKSHADNTSNPHKVTKLQLELGNVDNTSDANKPVSLAVEAELDKKADSDHRHYFTDLLGGEIRLINPSTSSEGYFYLVNWRYTNYDRFVLAYRKKDGSDIPLLEYKSSDNTLNPLVDMNLKIGNNSVAELINSKANINHTHSLSNITGLIDRLSSLQDDIDNKADESHTHTVNDLTGLGTAATKGVATSVANGNTNLVTSGAVYSAINNLNTNNRTHIVVASYDTKNPLKVNVDYTCTATNATSVLKTAINAVAQGGKVELLDGTYNLQYNEDAIELTKEITIEGSGYRTVINQPIDESGGGEAKPIFIINSQNVKLKSMMVCDEDISSPVDIIEQKATGVIYDDVFFIFNGKESTSDSACIRGFNDCRYTRIQNCRVYKSFSTGDKVMFDFSGCTNFGGIIGANISSGYNNISVKFANESHKNNTAVYGHNVIDLLV